MHTCTLHLSKMKKHCPMPVFLFLAGNLYYFVLGLLLCLPLSSAILSCTYCIPARLHNFLSHWTRGVTKRCRLSWLTNSALAYEPQMVEGGSCWVSANKYSCAHGTQIINFGDLSPYLTYALDLRTSGSVPFVSVC